MSTSPRKLVPLAHTESRSRALFEKLNRRADALAHSDDILPAQSLAASASAMIADSLTRLCSIEPGQASHVSPAPTPDAVSFLRLVGGMDDEAPDRADDQA